MVSQPLRAYGGEVVQVPSRYAAPAAAMPGKRTTDNDEQGKKKDHGQSDETLHGGNHRRAMN